ncbi:MAG TPA: ankyrin repeat domain-containing protein [Bryobacteraceae bacterium]|nr:ankyrin repeat domain-containing protein [Bryobacteraceae bacterium]
MAFLAAVAVSILIGGVCLTPLLYELYYWRQHRASLSWRQVTGTISRTGVTGRSSIFGSTIRAEVIYLYEVYGVSHVGTRTGFDKVTYATEKEAQAALAAYPVNSTVTVYFDPANPEYSVLTREYHSVMRLLVFLYGSLAVLTLLLVIERRFDPQRRNPTPRTQTRVQPWTPPPLVKEPTEGPDIRRDANVTSEPDIVAAPKFRPKVAKVAAKAGTQAEPNIKLKAKPQGDRTAALELYAALRAKKPVPVIEALLNRNPAIDGASPFNVPLVASAEGCEPESARLLLAKGADPNAPYSKGMAAKMNQPTALMAAAANGCASVAQILLESGANSNVTTAEPALVVAVKHQSDEIARLLLDHGADPTSDGQFGPSPLGAAAFYANDAMVRLLLSRGAKVNQADASGKTAIYHLLEGNHSDSSTQGAVLTVARDLLKAGASPNLPLARGGVTPLMLAAEKDMSSVLRLLIENGADPKAVDGIGRTALMHAISKDNADAVDQLLTRGVSVNARDQKGTTALGYTKQRPNSPQTRRIIAALRNAGAAE